MEKLRRQSKSERTDRLKSLGILGNTKLCKTTTWQQDTLINTHHQLLPFKIEINILTNIELFIMYVSITQNINHIWSVIKY